MTIIAYQRSNFNVGDILHGLAKTNGSLKEKAIDWHLDWIVKLVELKKYKFQKRGLSRLNASFDFFSILWSTLRKWKCFIWMLQQEGKATDWDTEEKNQSVVITKHEL